MNKEEFLTKLRKKINILEDSEIEDIVSEYEGYIEEKVSRGLTEEEAVKELGDLNEITRDLLAAYKVKEPESTWSFNAWISKISKYIDNFIDTLSKKSFKEIIRYLIEIILILIVIGILKIPFEILKEFGWDVFHELNNTIGNTFYSIWAFIIELTYFILAVLVFFKIIDRRYFKNISEKIANEEPPKEETKSSINQNNAEKKDNVTYKKEENKPESKDKGFINTLTNICIIFLKIITIFCLVGVIAYLVGMAFATGIMIYLIINGVKYFGFLILLIAMLFGGALFLELGINFITNKRVKGRRLLIEILTIIILVGIGLTMSTIEIADTEIIYNNYYNTKSITKEIDMQNDLVLYNYDEIVIDNSLDNIKIEYVYPDFNDNLSIEIDLSNCGKGYCLNAKENYFKITKKITNDIIENLKNKKLYIYEYDVTKTIYLNEENYKKIIENKNKYYNYEERVGYFTKKYSVISVNEREDERYLYLNLLDVNTKMSDTVKILSKQGMNIVPGNIYEFKFEYELDEDINFNSIDEVFDECNLISITSIDTSSNPS